MKRFVQCVCLILAFTIIFPIPAMATEASNSRGSDYFAKYSCYLWEISDTQFEIWFDITALDTMDKLGTSTITLYRSSDEVNWTPVKTYTKEGYSQMVAENRGRYANCVTYSYSTGYSYYAEVVFYAKQGSATATMTINTPIKEF